jgi:hypothetical protein
MKYCCDHDGKSKTASAVDAAHYPEQDEVENPNFEEALDLPTREQIAERALKIWHTRGCPPNSALLDWLQAEEELKAAFQSRNVIEATARRYGSVQS